MDNYLCLIGWSAIEERIILQWEYWIYTILVIKLYFLLKQKCTFLSYSRPWILGRSITFKSMSIHIYPLTYSTQNVNITRAASYVALNNIFVKLVYMLQNRTLKQLIPRLKNICRILLFLSCKRTYSNHLKLKCYEFIAYLRPGDQNDRY